MEIIEIPHFTEVVMDYLSDDDYSAFQWFIAFNPDAGDLVKGARKVRWKSSKTGKRGGLRIIYSYKPKPTEISMLTIYTKSRKQDLSMDDKDTLKKIIQEIKQ